MRRILVVGLVAVFALAAGVVVAGTSKRDGRIGRDNRIQPSGRQLDPVGKMTRLGNLPAGGALTTNGRFAWTLSAGRGDNDIRIVAIKPAAGQRTGEVVQKVRMPGLNGGMAMALDGKTAYVSGTPESGHDDQKVGGKVPGQEGDVIHVFKYNRRTGRARRAGVIDVPPPPGAPVPQGVPVRGPFPVGPPIPQNFPPTNADPQSWPRDLAVSPDGKTVLAALNLADRAAVVDARSEKVEYVETGSYPYGAAITPDGERGLVSNEAEGTVSVIDLDRARKIKDIKVGPNLSHPEGIAIDPRRPRAYVAVTHQDLIAVVRTDTLEVERTLSVERPGGIGTAPVQVSVTDDGCRLLAADSGEDAVAVFSLSTRRACEDSGGSGGRGFRHRSAPDFGSSSDRGNRRARAAGDGDAARGSRAQRADRILQREGRDGVELAESEEEERAELFGEEAEERAEVATAARPARQRTRKFQLLGRVPVGSYPVAAFATPNAKKLVWIAAKGLGVGPNASRNGESESGEVIADDPGSAASGAPKRFRFDYLPSHVFGNSGILNFPSDERLDRLTPRSSEQIRPSNDQERPPGNPIGPDSPIEHVFYIVRENRTYDQILGDDPRGDGDPKLTLFGKNITPNAHALAKRFPLLDHVYANSEASIDGHFWTSAAAVSDYVVKNWHQNYANRERPYDFGVYSVTWPSQRFLFDQSEKQDISYFNYGEAIAGTVPLPDKDRGPQETQEVADKFENSDLGEPDPPNCFPNDASSGGTDVVRSAGPGPDVEVYDSSIPEGAPPGPLSRSRFDCFKRRFNLQLASDAVPAFNYVTLSNDHTAGTTPGQRTPNAMIAENDYALGQMVELISSSEIWDKSLILVIEDDSQDGADHVDAHRIPAFAISPYARRGAVVHTRYDFLSFIRTLELVVGMEPLNLFDSLAVPMYDAFDGDPSDNDEPYDAIEPNVDLTERNTESSPNSRLSSRLPLNFTDRTPQRYLDRILWQYVHGKDSEPPPPGPNASRVDEATWEREGRVTPEQALGELMEEADNADE